MNIWDTQTGSFHPLAICLLPILLANMIFKSDPPFPQCSGISLLPLSVQVGPKFCEVSLWTSLGPHSIGHSPSSTKSFPSFLSLFLSDLDAASGCFLINLALKQGPWGCWSPYSAALRSSWGQHQTGAETATPLNLLSCRWPDSQFKPFC